MYLYYYSQDGCGQIILRRRVGCDTIKTGIENARKRGKTMKTNVSQAIMEMIQYESGNPQRINHFLKVHSFAKAIGEMEGLDERTLNILEMASVMHDIGIKPSLIKYHSSSGRHQQVEGPAPATEIMKRLGQDAEMIDRVCWLIAHHHTITGVEKIDHRILLEADFLVNIFEGEFSRKQVDSIREKVFRTQTGLNILQHMFYERKE